MDNHYDEFGAWDGICAQCEKDAPEGAEGPFCSIKCQEEHYEEARLEYLADEQNAEEGRKIVQFAE